MAQNPRVVCVRCASQGTCRRGAERDTSLARLIRTQLVNLAGFSLRVRMPPAGSGPALKRRSQRQTTATAARRVPH